MPPGSEEESLRISLDRHRDAVPWKLAGVGDADLRRPVGAAGARGLPITGAAETSQEIWLSSGDRIGDWKDDRLGVCLAGLQAVVEAAEESIE